MADDEISQNLPLLTAAVAKDFLSRGGWTRGEAILILNGFDPNASERVINDDTEPRFNPSIQTFWWGVKRFKPKQRIISVSDWLEWATRGTNDEPRHPPLAFARDLEVTKDTGDYLRLEKKIAYTVLVQNNGCSQPWLVKHPDDPEPKSAWYTPARYFARQWVRQEPALLESRKDLAKKVARDLGEYRIFKRGGQLVPKVPSIVNAFSRVKLTA